MSPETGGSLLKSWTLEERICKMTAVLDVYFLGRGRGEMAWNLSNSPTHTGLVSPSLAACLPLPDSLALST